MKIHILIVTGQAMANYLPVLLEKAGLLALLVSDSMQQKAAELSKKIQHTPELTGTQLQLYPGLPDSQLAAIQEYGLKIRMALEEAYPNAQFVYDLTGGSKLMALALASVFQDKQYRQVYLNTDHNQMEVVYPSGENAIALPALVDSKSQLESNGFTWRKAQSASAEWRDSVNTRRDLSFNFATLLGRHTDMMQNFIRQLNRAASLSQQAQQPVQQLNYLPRGLYPLMVQLTEAGLIDWAEDNDKTLYFCSDDAIRYLNGGWLEEYFYLVAQQTGIADSHTGVEVTNNFDPKADIRNEIDGVCSVNNRLLLVECKTAKLGGNDEKDAQILYKLSAIANQLGGQYCTRLLLAALPVDHTTKDQREVKITKRANADDIQVVAGPDILHLKQYLQHWQQYGRWPAKPR